MKPEDTVTRRSSPTASRLTPPGTLVSELRTPPVSPPGVCLRFYLDFLNQLGHLSPPSPPPSSGSRKSLTFLWIRPTLRHSLPGILLTPFRRMSLHTFFVDGDLSNVTNVHNESQFL